MREITLKVYKFEELSEEVQEKVIDRNRYIEVEFGDWWDCVYDMALEEGVRIRSFDLHGREIEVELDLDQDEVEKEILESGELGVELLATLDEEDEDDREYALEEALHDAFMEYRKEKLEEAESKWLVMLDKEADYLTSDEYVKEFLVNNEYEFYENGEVV